MVWERHKPKSCEAESTNAQARGGLLHRSVDPDIRRKTLGSGLLPELIAVLRRSPPGDLVAVVGDDESIGPELETWCRFTGNPLLEATVEKGRALWVSSLPSIMPCCSKKVNGKNRCVSAVLAAKRQRPIFQICDHSNGASDDRYDFGHPAEIGVAHGDRTTGMAAPLIGLQVGKVAFQAISMRGMA
jgi:hypothetical protein